MSSHGFTDRLMHDLRTARRSHPLFIVFSGLARRIDRHLDNFITRRGVARASRFSRSAIHWTRSHHYTWVATLSDRFLGMVEEVDGAYVANNTAAGTYNTYRTLAEAMEAFEPHGSRGTSS